MNPRPQFLSRRRVEARRAADDATRAAIGRAFPAPRGLPRVCRLCGRVNDLLHRITGRRQSVYAVLFRFFDWMHGHGASYEELLPLAELPVWYLADLFGRTPLTPVARSERATGTGAVLRLAA